MSRSGDLPASTRVVRAVAAAEGVDPVDLPPLADAIDPDALDALVAGTPPTEPADQYPELRFPYAGFEVHVTDGEVDVEPLDGT